VTTFSYCHSCGRPLPHVQRLTEQGLTQSPKKPITQSPKLEAIQMPEAEELSTTLDPLTLTVTTLMLAAVRDAKKHSEYVKEN